MGRYWIVVFNKGSPEPPRDQLLNADDLPTVRKDGLMSRFVIGFMYSSASGTTRDMLTAGGYTIEQDGKVTIFDAARALLFPALPLLARFFVTSETSWSHDECVKIARDLGPLFADVLEEERMPPLQLDVQWVPEAWEVDMEAVAAESDSAILERRFGWGEQILRVFEEAVTRLGTVETN